MLQVLQDGVGELTVNRRPSTQEDARPEMYLPCTECKSWILEKNLSNHAKTCPCGKIIDTNFLRNSRMLISPFIKINSNETDIDEILDKMKETVKYPKLKEIAQGDVLIREFIRGLVNKLGTEDEQRRKDKDNIRTKVRAVARLLKALNEKTGETKSLIEYIRPQCFMLVVEVVKNIGLSFPNLALCLGHYIRQLALLKQSYGLQLEDKELQKQGENFSILYGAHWNNYVAAACLRRLKLLALNKSHKLPLTSDLVKFKEFLDKEIDNFLKVPKPNRKQWMKGAQALLARIVIFNKRRIAEVEELLVTDITGEGTEDSEDIVKNLDITERALAKRMTVVEVRGKSTRGLRKVFVILSESMKKGCLHLINTRLYVGNKGKYLFARQDSEKTPIDGCETMREMSKDCPDLQKPELIRTRLLRKHLATIVQLLDMTGDELKMVADHMGHSVAIHTDVYRLQSSLLEKTKVARALIAAENGLMGKFAGRSLSACDLNEIPVVEEEDVEKTLSCIPNPVVEVEKINEDLAVSERYEETDEIRDDRTEQNSTEETDNDVHEKVQNESSSKRKREEIPEKSNKAPKAASGRQRWSAEEEKSLYNAFKTCIQVKTDVSADQIRKAQTVYPCLKQRSVAVIKTKLNNIKLGKCSLKVFE